jgi:hypothetical protein
MKRKKRTKADIITSVLYVIFGLIVAAALYGLGTLVHGLLGSTLGNSYYADLAEDMRVDDTVNFAALSAQNPAIKGWIELDDTAIDLPIVQADDNTYYLTHRFDDKKTSSAPRSSIPATSGFLRPAYGGIRPCREERRDVRLLLGI